MAPSEAVGPGYATPMGRTSLAAVDDNSSTASGVTWGAVFAGGVTAAALSVILLVLGLGLGLASVSPWRGSGMGVGTFTALAAIWLIIVQWIASGFGGYMAGRLRTKWTAVHTDEVFFRDTAHGFLAWALGTLLVVGVLSGVGGSVMSNGTQAADTVAKSTNTANNYYVNLLLRQNAGANGAVATGVSAPGMSDQDIRQQASVILAEGALNNDVPNTDRVYLAQLVSEKTGLAPADAQTRVTDVLNREHADVVKVKQVTDAARKSASAGAIYTFISLLIGAFIASVAGAIGGRLRDNY